MMVLFYSLGNVNLNRTVGEMPMWTWTAGQWLP